MTNMIVRLFLSIQMSAFIFASFTYADHAQRQFTYMTPDKENIHIIPSPFPTHQIEIYLQKSEQQEAPLVVFLNGASGNGVQGFTKIWFDYWYDKGYTVAAISMPGHGDSTGKNDLCGPFVLESLHFAINAIKDELQVQELGIVGFGLGGWGAVLLSSQRNDLKCIVCANGAYDLSKHEDLKEKNYDVDLEDDHALATRSPIFCVKSINSPIYLLHRKGHPETSEEEVSNFYTAMLEEGKECYLAVKDRFSEEFAQKITYEEVLEETEGWVDTLLQK